MDKLTAEIIKEQMIGETSGHMASIPNSPILFSMFQAYEKIKYQDIMTPTRELVFKDFIADLNGVLNVKQSI